MIKQLLDAIDPELRDDTRKTPTVSFANPILFPIIKHVAFPLRGLKGRYRGGEVTLETTGAGLATFRILRPKKGTNGAGVLWIHGGGLVVGHPRQDDAVCAKIAIQLNATVVSFRYRLAPKHPFPAGLNDCYAAWNWLQKQAEELQIDPKNVVVGGQSAGGGLAAALCQRLFDDGGVQPVAQCLVYPMLDDRTAAHRDKDGKHLIWNNQSNRFAWKAYLGQDPGAAQSPDYAVAARREALQGLPPAWIGVGDCDLFKEESRAYADRLKAAGVPVKFVLVKGAPHGFLAMSPDNPISGAFITSIELPQQSVPPA